jgi:hypothetical protein
MALKATEAGVTQRAIAEYLTAVKGLWGLFLWKSGSFEMNKKRWGIVLFASSLLFSGVCLSEENATTEPAGAAMDFSVDGNGNVTAASFAGDGSALTNLSAVPSPWVSCGNLSDLVFCELPDFPSTDYEYGIAFVSPPIPYLCTGWNSGSRIYNQHPFFIDSDIPDAGMRYGGVLFYSGTNSADDDLCTGASGWKHRYWYLDHTDSLKPVKTWASNGCIDQELFCRLH